MIDRAGQENSAQEAAKSSRALRRERDVARGYSVNYVRLGMAYGIEVVVLTASLVGAYLFARQYGDNSSDTIAMMMLAPIGYAAIEFCRVPLAFSARTQTSWTIKILAVVAVICAAGVTIKSMSQLGEIMFRPRLQEATRAHHALNDALAQQRFVKETIDVADQAVAGAKSNLDQNQERVKAANAGLAGLPATRCFPVTTTTRDGRRVRSTTCRDDPRLAAMKLDLERANSDLAIARQAFDDATRKRGALNPAEADQRAAAAKTAYDEAIFRSQLHSFTGMAFGKDPKTVSDGEIAEFLRIFVFFPAIFVSFAATMLAATSVERIRPRPEADAVALSDAAAHYILGPYSQAIIEEAKQTVVREQRKALIEVGVAAREEPRMEAPPVNEVAASPPAANAAPPVAPPATGAGEAQSRGNDAVPPGGVVTPLRRV